MQMTSKLVLTAVMVMTLLIAGTLIYYTYFARRRLKISTTTSLYDTGLLDAVEREFEAKYPVDITFYPVGTGIAIEQAKRGDADATLVHSPSLEKTFLEEGYGVCRKIIAFNYFAIVGNVSDNAHIEGTTPTEALQRIVTYGRSLNHIVWVSRGDSSGTHMKEKSLWQKAGFNWSVISKEPWYLDVGAGMGQTLMRTDYEKAYTITDMGTYLAYHTRGVIALKPLVEQQYDLLNVYSVITANKTLHPDVNFEDAILFTKFLVSDEGQELVESYGKDKYGHSLFFGAVEIPAQNMASQDLQWIKEYAYFNGSECPPQYRDGHPELYPNGRGTDT